MKTYDNQGEKILKYMATFYGPKIARIKYRNASTGDSLIEVQVKEPVLLHAPTRKSVGYFGAVRLRDEKFVYAREEDKFNAQSYWQFLKQLRQRSLPSTKREVITIDNAKFHQALLHEAWREEAMPQFRKGAYYFAEGQRRQSVFSSANSGRNRSHGTC